MLSATFSFKGTNRLALRRPGEGREHSPHREVSEYDCPDQYNAPDYWQEQQDWMRPGPFTGVGPRNYKRSDERILEDVNLRLHQHAQIDASDIDVSVNDGEVTLEGTVEDRRMKRMVEANVERITGVIDVHDNQALGGLKSPSWFTTSIPAL